MLLLAHIFVPSIIIDFIPIQDPSLKSTNISISVSNSRLFNAMHVEFPHPKGTSYRRPIPNEIIEDISGSFDN